MGMARRLPFFAHPCLSLRACTFLSSALWDNAAGEKRGPDLAAPEESGRELIDKPCKNGPGQVDITARGAAPPVVFNTQPTNAVDKRPIASQRAIDVSNGLCPTTLSHSPAPRE